MDADPTRGDELPLVQGYDVQRMIVVSVMPASACTRFGNRLSLARPHVNTEAAYRIKQRAIRGARDRTNDDLFHTSTLA